MVHKERQNTTLEVADKLQAIRNHQVITQWNDSSCVPLILCNLLKLQLQHSLFWISLIGRFLMTRLNTEDLLGSLVFLETWSLIRILENFWARWEKKAFVWGLNSAVTVVWQFSACKQETGSDGFIKPEVVFWRHLEVRIVSKSGFYEVAITMLLVQDPRDRCRHLVWANSDVWRCFLEGLNHKWCQPECD